MNRILLLEDHERLAELIVRQLASAGIATDVFSRLNTAWAALELVNYQGIILDRSLPDGEGLSLLTRMKHAGRSIPCLVLTARDTLHDRVEGLEKGADDYLTKPFAMDELVARVRALLRRPIETVELEPSFGDLQVRPTPGIMCCRGESISLAPAELQIMLLLIRKQGEVVRHSSLEAAGWGLNDVVTPNALDVLIYRLRRKLMTIGSRLQIINMRKAGYVLR